MKLYMQMLQSSAAFLLVAVSLLLVSCEKSEDINDSYPASGDGQCMLLPPSIMVEPFGGGSVFTRAASAIKEERHQFNVGEELGNIITLGNGETDTEEIAQTRANIAAGVFYRIVIYTATEYSGSLKITEQRLCKTGSSNYFADADDSTEPIYLYPGTYKIFCYSFNNATAIPKLSDGTSTIALTDDDDFMSTVVEKTIGNTDLGKNVNLGGITLYHRCCKLTGKLTAEGFDNSNITGTPSLSISGTFSKTGTWSITGSSFSQSTTFESKTINLSGSDASRSGSVIMLPIPNGTALKTTYSFMPTSAKKTVAQTNATLSSGQDFISGQSYAFTIKAVGAYVITEGVESIKIGSNTWATRNCRWDNTFETNLDIWNSGNLRGSGKGTSSSAETSSDYNSYFNWGMKTPSSNKTDYENGASWSSTNNPCPSGYKVPSTAQFKDLVASNPSHLVPQGKKVLINGEIHTIGNAHGFYNGSNDRGMVLVDGSNVLFLPAAGNRYDTSWRTVGSSGGYWSSTPNGSNAYSLYFYGGDIRPEDDFNRYYGFSVRCVK